MQRWVKFIAKHPDAHVLLGRTRNITQWRNNGLRQLINAQHPSEQVSVRRDLDDEQGYLLILIAFANEADAVKLAEVLAAKRVDAYGGYPWTDVEANRFHGETRAKNRWTPKP